MASRKSSTRHVASTTSDAARVYPFTAIVGQEEMRLALLLCIVEPAIGGVLITGHRGTGKSTAVRALAALLPPLTRAALCPFNCDPETPADLCDACRATLDMTGRLKRERARVPVVDLPLNATEDRVCGSINLERALAQGVRTFDPGLLARAHRGFLYVDEVNLLEDHLVDLLLDVSATGRNRVEREGISAEHAARFVLVGSSNPEEGELRPQLLDRFGLCAEVRTPDAADERAEIVTRREAFDRDPVAFHERASNDQAALRRRLVRARREATNVVVPTRLVRAIAELCARLGVDGHRGELTIARASRALAAFEGRKIASEEDARRVAQMALRHRLRRDPFEQTGGGGQIEQVADEIFGAGGAKPSERRQERAQDTNERAAAARERSATGKQNAASDDRVAWERAESVEDRSDRSERREDESDSRASHPEGARAASAMNGATLHAPPVEFNPSLDFASGAFDVAGVAREGSSRKRSTSSARARSSVKSQNAARGRFSGGVTSHATARNVAFEATLRAAAERQTRIPPRDIQAQLQTLTPRAAQTQTKKATPRNSRTQPEMTMPHDARTTRDSQTPRVVAGDLRFKLFKRKTGTLFIFAVDASGSMALNRIGQAKGGLAQLLRRSYVRRDRVALVSFRESRGEILLRPSRSPALAKRLLDALPVGGATPLASGLLCAQEIAARALREGAGRVALLVFTDGRANVPVKSARAEDGASLRLRIDKEIKRIGEALRRAGVESVVIDTRARFALDVEGKKLAKALGGSYTRLSAALPA
jgi:magnesium chelatase subunit I